MLRSGRARMLTVNLLSQREVIIWLAQGIQHPVDSGQSRCTECMGQVPPWESKRCSLDHQKPQWSYSSCKITQGAKQSQALGTVSADFWSSPTSLTTNNCSGSKSADGETSLKAGRKRCAGRRPQELRTSDLLGALLLPLLSRLPPALEGFAMGITKGHRQSHPQRHPVLYGWSPWREGKRE